MTKLAILTVAVILSIFFGATYIAVAQQATSTKQTSGIVTRLSPSKCIAAQEKLIKIQASIDEMDRKMEGLLIQVEDAKTGQIEAVIALLKESVYERKMIRMKMQEMESIRSSHLAEHFLGEKRMNCLLNSPNP